MGNGSGAVQILKLRTRCLLFCREKKKMKPSGVEVNVKTVKFSPFGKYIAYAVQNELFVTVTETGDVVGKFACSDLIDFLDWSIDSEHILCGICQRHSVEAFSIADPDWFCTIKEEATGIRDAKWSPTGYHILTVAEFNSKISIWSLIGRSVAYIENPILRNEDSLQFSPSGEYLAVLTGCLENDQITLFSTTSWTVKRILKCSGEIQLPAGPLWSSNSSYLAIWETIDLKTCKCEIYSLEKKVGEFSKTAKNETQAIRSVAWSPNGQFLAIGLYNEEIEILNYITWTPLMNFKHSQVVTDKQCSIFQEIHEENAAYELKLERSITFTRLKKSLHPIRLPGVKNLLFSHDSQYIASVSELMPAVVWIWDLNDFKIRTILVLKEAISDLKWDLKEPNLLICSKSNNVTIWQPDKPIHLDLSKFGIGEHVFIHTGSWCPNSKRSHLCLLSSSSMYIIQNF